MSPGEVCLEGKTGALSPRLSAFPPGVPGISVTFGCNPKSGAAATSRPIEKTIPSPRSLRCQLCSRVEHRARPGHPQTSPPAAAGLSCGFPGGGVPAPRPPSHTGSRFPISPAVPSPPCASGSGSELPRDTEVFPLRMLQRRGCTPRGGPPPRPLLPTAPGPTETSRCLYFPGSEKTESHGWLD